MNFLFLETLNFDSILFSKNTLWLSCKNTLSLKHFVLFTSKKNLLSINFYPIQTLLKSNFNLFFKCGSSFPLRLSAFPNQILYQKPIHLSFLLLLGFVIGPNKDDINY